jgi:hypothetical protein
MSKKYVIHEVSQNVYLTGLLEYSVNYEDVLIFRSKIYANEILTLLNQFNSKLCLNLQFHIIEIKE